MPQHLSHCIGFLLYGIALEPGGGAGGVVGVGQGAWWGMVSMYLQLTYIAQVCLYTWHIPQIVRILIQQCSIDVPVFQITQVRMCKLQMAAITGNYYAII